MFEGARPGAVWVIPPSLHGAEVLCFIAGGIGRAFLDHEPLLLSRGASVCSPDTSRSAEGCANGVFHPSGSGVSWNVPSEGCARGGEGFVSRVRWRTVGIVSRGGLKGSHSQKPNMEGERGCAAPEPESPV